MTVRLFDARRLPPGARKPALLERAARLALGPALRRRGELNVIFTDDPGIRRVNRTYLGHDYATDVIAFAYPKAEVGTLEEPPFGDVYVSVQRAAAQARALRHPLIDEVVTLVLHGCLHLVGYDDRAATAKKRMFARQDRLLARLRP